MVTIGGYFGFAGVPLLTNATKVVGYAKAAQVMNAAETLLHL